MPANGCRPHRNFSLRFKSFGYETWHLILIGGSIVMWDAEHFLEDLNVGNTSISRSFKIDFTPRKERLKNRLLFKLIIFKRDAFV